MNLKKLFKKRINLFSVVLFIFFIYLVHSVAAGQSEIITWEKTYGRSNTVGLTSLIQVEDRGYAIAGWASSKDSRSQDFWFIRLDEYGNLLWDRIYGESIQGYVFSLIQTNDGGYAVAGVIRSQTDNKQNAWLLKLDSQGNILWEKTYGGSDEDRVLSIIQTSDGGFALAGWTKSKGTGEMDAWVLKLDIQGNILWDRTYGGSGFESARAIIQTTDGGYALAGVTSVGAGFYDFWIIKLDELGNEDWLREYKENVDHGISDLIQTTDGGYILAISTASKGAGSLDFLLIKLDSQGNLLWDRTCGGNSWDRANSLIQATDGGYAVAGTTYSKGLGTDNFWLIRLDINGNFLWDRTYGEINSSYDKDCFLIKTTDGGLVLAGEVKSKGNRTQDIRIFKVDEQGNLLSGIEGLTEEVEIKNTAENTEITDDKSQVSTETSTTMTQTIPVPSFDSYQWEVGLPGFTKPGDITYFGNAKPSTVQLSNPSNGTTLPLGNIPFSWNPVSNATKYQFVLYNSQGKVALDTPINSTSLTVTLGIEETITWKVRAGDNSGNWGPWSSLWSLSLKSTTVSTESSPQISETAYFLEEEITFKTFNYKDDYAEYSAKYPDWPNIPEAEFTHIGLKKFLNVGYSKEVSVNMIISQDFDLMDLFKFLREAPEDLEKEAMKRGKTIEFYMGSTQIIKDEKTDNVNFMELLLDLDGEFFKKDKEDINAFLNSSKIHVLFKDFYCKENNKYFSVSVSVAEEKWSKYQNIAKSIINSMKVIKITESSPQNSDTTCFLTGSLHCPEKSGYPCDSCSSASGYINHFKGFNVLTTNEDCYVKLTYNDGDYIGNKNSEVTIKGEKWLGLEDELGTELVEEINSGRFNFKPADKFIGRTMNFPGDNYKYEFANEGREFRLYLSRDRAEAFKAAPWQNIIIEIKNKETDKVFTYKFEKGIFPLAYTWSNGVANYGQCVWWTAKRWVEEVDSKTLFPFYPPSPQDVNVIKIDSDYQSKRLDILIDYIPGGQPGHYGFVEKVDEDLVHITQFNFIKPGEVYNYISRFWNGNPKTLYYSLNPHEKYYFKYYYRK